MRKMDDIRTVVKELRRIADAGERIAKGLEKLNRTPTVNVSYSGDVADGDIHKEWVKEVIKESTVNET